MLPWWIIFLVVALVAAGFGFVGLSDGGAGTAEVYLFIFIVVFALFVVGRVRGRQRAHRIELSQRSLDGTGIRQESGRR